MTDTTARPPARRSDTTPTGVPWPAAWYPDPQRRYPLRYWDGRTWSDWTSDGHLIWWHPLAVTPPVRATSENLRFVVDVLLPLARGRGIVTGRTSQRLEQLTEELTGRDAEVVNPSSMTYTALTGTRAAGTPTPATPGATPGATPPATPPAMPQRPTAPPVKRETQPPETQPPETQPPATRPRDIPPPVTWPPETRPPVPTAPPARPAQLGRAAQPAPSAGQTGPSPEPAPVSAAESRPRGSWRRALRRAWHRFPEGIRSEIGVHGLAYLGVLLLFIGMFGLLVFAFAEVTPWLRPATELVVAIAPLAVGRMLQRTGAVAVGRALQLCGGLLLPLALMTPLLDGVGAPPDLTGARLAFALTGICVAIAAGYALWTRRHRDTVLAYLVAPMLWLAVAMATLGVGRDIPSGKDVAVPEPAQLAAVIGAVVVSVLLARRWPVAALARPTLVSAVPGLLVTSLLAVLAWSAASWPAGPALMTGVLTLAGIDLLDVRLPVAAVAAAEPVWWAIVWLALTPDLGQAPAAALATVGFIALVERSAARHQPWSLLVPAAGVGVAAAATWVSPWWAVATLTVVSAWALFRRQVPLAAPAAPVVADVAAAVAPLAALAALSRATAPAVSVAACSGLVLVAVVPATRPVLRRGPSDRFWTWWWWGGLAVATATSVPAWVQASTPAPQWAVVGALAALAAACAGGPLPAVARPWAVMTLAGAGWLAACDITEVTAGVRGAALAAAGLALVAAAHRPAAAAEQYRAGSVGLAGHVLGLAAIGAAGTGWGLVAAVAIATAGWAISAARDLADRSPVGRLLGAVAAELRYLPWGLVAIGLPLTVSLTLDVSGALPVDGVWAPSVAAVTAVAYAAVARLPVPARVATTSVWSAFGAGLVAVAASGDPGALALGLASLITAIGLLPRSARPLFMVWVAWAAVAPLVGALAEESSGWYRGLDDVTRLAAPLVAAGGALVVGAAAVDTRHGWRARWRPTVAALYPVVTVGAADMALALLLLGGLPRTTAGWVLAATATTALAAAVLGRAGSAGGLAAVLGWAAALLLAPDALAAEPWIAALAAGALLAGAALGDRLGSDRRWWTRWDVPLAIASVPPAAAALLWAAEGHRPVATHLMLGVLALAAAWWERRAPQAAVPLAALGAFWVLTAAAEGGRGWLSLALCGWSVVLVIGAQRSRGAVRMLFTAAAVACAAAAWGTGLTWLSWSPQHSLDLTAVGAGTIALLSAFAAYVRRVARTVVVAFGSTAVVVTAAAAIAGEQPAWWAGTISLAPSGWVAAGTGLASLALLGAAPPLRQGWLRDLGAAGMVATTAIALQAADADATGRVGVWVTLTLVFAVLAALVRALQPARPWERPCLEAGVAASVLALVGAVTLLPERPALVAALAASSVLAAVAGMVLRSVAVESAAPVLACAAWLTFASESLTGDAQWFTVPIGFAMLAVVTLLRHDRVNHGLPPREPGAVALELVGIAFLVGASLVEAVTVSVGYAWLAAALGGGVGVWGLETRVRRRVAAGAAIILVSLVLLVAVPLVRLAPAAGGALAWLAVACVGLIALAAATSLERGLTLVRSSRARLTEATRGWE